VLRAGGSEARPSLAKTSQLLAQIHRNGCFSAGLGELSRPEQSEILLIEHRAAVQEVVLLQTFGGVSSAEAARSGGRMGGSSFSAARSGGGSYSRYSETAVHSICFACKRHTVHTSPVPWHVLLCAFRNCCNTSSLLFKFLLGVQLRCSCFLAVAAAAGVMAVA